mgnify:CR=1 FL=1
MSQNNSNEKAAMLPAIENINKVDGFDPTPFAVEYTDLNTGETNKRLPVLIQIAWFRMKYPNGKISVQVAPAKDCFVATARIYPDYKDSHQSMGSQDISYEYVSDGYGLSLIEEKQGCAHFVFLWHGNG